MADSLRDLDQLIANQVLADGGHASRSPHRLLAVLAILVEIRAALTAAHVEPTAALLSAIDRAVPFVKALRLGDGGFALFNGSLEMSPSLIDAVLDAAGGRAKAISNAPHTGFQRLTAKSTVLVMDAGSSVNDPMTHAGVLGFEMSVGKNRLIVNCGRRAEGGEDWARALRGTAAHSTLCLGERNASEIGAAGRVGPRMAKVQAERREADGALFVEARHDGYLAPFGATHARSVYMAADGKDIRGEDRLEGGDADTALAIRFHLHPTIKASLAGDAMSVLLKLPRGRGWRFRSDHPLTIESSVYFGDGSQRATSQIVITGRHANSRSEVKWRLSEETGAG